MEERTEENEVGRMGESMVGNADYILCSRSPVPKDKQFRQSVPD